MTIMVVLSMQAKVTKRMVHTKATARVETTPTGEATINMKATVPRTSATSSVSISIKSGTVSAQCSAHEPAKNKKENPPNTPKPVLLLPPWDSAML